MAKTPDSDAPPPKTPSPRIHTINEMFCDPTFFDRTPRDQVKNLKGEQKTLSVKVEELMGE